MSSFLKTVIESTINQRNKESLVDDLLEANIQNHKFPYRELGSIEGYVKSVGRNGKGVPTIIITDRLDGKDIKCISKDGGFEKIGNLNLDDILGGLRLRVHGMIFYKSLLKIDKIDVEKIELFEPEENLPNIQDLIDHNYTAGLDSVEFIKRIREDG